ncbi:MAG TPA: glycosyltransferase family 39 protein [bacterium]|nr:glycosyltransferase family 39 protein [bacterium]HPQ66515.1 glycosyltransferase family 39 protein [bacterium]
MANENDKPLSGAPAAGGSRRPDERTPLLPLNIFLPEIGPRKVAGLIAFFVVLAVTARSIRYLLCFPLWPDEGFLAANFICARFDGLLGPLAYHQVAPLFFLWTEAAAVKLLGFNEYALRVFPFLCGIGAVFLFVRVARNLLGGLPALLAVALFAVSYYPIRHAVEIKPYSVDLAVSLLLTLGAVAWLRNPEKTAPLWALVVFAPIAVGLSFPAAFTGGGIVVALLPAAWGRLRSRIAWCCLPLTLIAGFLVVYAVSTGPQLERESWLRKEDPATSSFNQDQAWTRTFPPLGHPGRLAAWLLRTHTGLLFAYPNGGHNGGSAATFVLFAVGAAVFFRRGRRLPLALLLSPFLFTFIAAILHRYPYGYSARFNLYLAPAICLLAGLGGARLIALISSPRLRKPVTGAALGLLALTGTATAAVDLFHPYKNIEDVRARDFARKFWRGQPRDVQTVCVYRDLGIEFFPRLFQWGHSSRYLCHQEIFRDDPGGGGATRSLRPLRVVVFSVPDRFEPYAALDEVRWRNWLETTTEEYEFVSHRRYQVNAGIDSHHETYDIYEFVPRPPETEKTASPEPPPLPGKPIDSAVPAGYHAVSEHR